MLSYIKYLSTRLNEQSVNLQTVLLTVTASSDSLRVVSATAAITVMIVCCDSSYIFSHDSKVVSNFYYFKV